MRLILHTGAYWLRLTMRDAVPNAALTRQSEVRNHLPAAAQMRAVIETVSQHSSCLRVSLFRCRIDPATCQHDRPRRTMTTRAVGALSNQSDQPSARS
jgi:hypothetical protein